MRTVTEYIRAHLLGEPTSLEELRETEWSNRFERLMRNRLLMGSYRYTRLHADTPVRWDTIGSIVKRAEAYRKDGNQEHLVDIANLALVEFVRPGCHNNPILTSVDDGEHAERC